MLRMLGERAVKVKRYLYTFFQDYTKVIDKVRHKEMLEMLQSLDKGWKNIQLILNLYWEQTAAIRINNEVGMLKELHRVCLKAVSFIRPFQLYAENILRELADNV